MLGGIEPLVRVAVEFGEGDRRAEGHAADAQRQRMAFADRRKACRLHGAADAFGDRLCTARIEAGQENAEFFAAEAGDEIEFADIRLDQVGDELERLIADVVAETVVDRLEVIDVKDQQRPVAARRLVVEAFEIGLDQRREGAAVEAVGQRIGRCDGKQLAVGERQLPLFGQQQIEKGRRQHHRNDDIVYPALLERPSGLEGIAVDRHGNGDADERAECRQQVDFDGAGGRQVEADAADLFHAADCSVAKLTLGSTGRQNRYIRSSLEVLRFQSRPSGAPSGKSWR